MSNTIERISIPELMDGRYLYIPAYQRGYRWTPKQVVDLLIDLFTYANAIKHDHRNVVEGDYYCLQPIVTRKIVDPDEIKEIENVSGVSPDPAKGIWEIVDGQQRLTTIYILYRYLMQRKSISSIEDLINNYSREPYHLFYATRKDSFSFLENIVNSKSTDSKNIDFYHMHQAYNTIDEWMQCKGDYEIGPYKVCGAIKLCHRYDLDETQIKVRDILWDLLNAIKEKKDNHYGNVQFLWYEIDAGKDVIQEFRETNMNQIRLTNAELIKALFLRTLSNDLVSDQEQLQRANQWEDIENTLQDSTFWSFLNRRGHDIPSRIDLLFTIRYHLEELKSQQADWTSLTKDDPERNKKIMACILQSEKNLETKDFLFNYFNDKFDGLDEESVADKIKSEWKEIMDIFHTFEDWYNDVVCYNLTGMLCQYENTKLARLYYEFLSLNDEDSREQFKQWLKSQVKEQLSNIKYKDDMLDIYYPDGRIFNLLLLLNINQLNKQAEESEETQTIFKFPFEILEDKWDIEHVDSHSTNKLEKDDDKKDWVEIAIKDLSIEDAELDGYIQSNPPQWDKAITRIKTLANEEDLTEEEKNHISNLTLLDAETNRSYGNSLFVIKRKRIAERIFLGKYVPATTSYVFMKLFDESGTSRSLWGRDDMDNYHSYICSELKDYLPSKPVQDHE